MNNHHIYYYFSNHSLYTLGCELLVEVQVDLYCAMNNHHIYYSFSNHSLYALGSELHRNTSRFCIAL